jgi:hypothetical protein
MENTKINTIPEYIEAIRNCPMEIEDGKYILRSKYGIRFHDRSIIFKGNLELVKDFYKKRKELVYLDIRSGDKNKESLFEYGNEEDFIRTRIESPPNFGLPSQLFSDYRKDFDFSVRFIERDEKFDRYRSIDNARNETMGVLEFAIFNEMTILLPIRTNLIDDLYYPSKEEVLNFGEK